MSEKRSDAKPIWVDYICDECGIGAMRQTDPTLLSSVRQLPHICNHCGARKDLYKSYPTVEFEEL